MSNASSPTVSPRSFNMAVAMETMRQQFQTLQREMEELRVQRNQRHHSSSSDSERRRRRRQRRDDDDERRQRRHDEDDRRERRREERLEGIKVTIPSFVGLNNPEAYLEWELKMEQLFDCHNYSEQKKVKVATLEFKEYALVWWDQYQKDRRRCGAEPVDDWEEMKVVMRKRFVPSSYQRDLHNKLQRLTQGNKTVDEYYKEMELALMRSNFNEDRETTMSRFLHGLNQDIQDVVELQPYVELEDLVQKAMKVEQQLKRRKTKFSSSSTPKFQSSNWEDKGRKETPTTKEAVGATQPKKVVEAPTRSREVKCFKCLGLGHIASQCPTRRTMVVRNGVVESETDSSSSEKSDEEEVTVPEGDLLMVRRLLGTQVREDEESQRENIFHTRCLVSGNVCSLIIDGGSCANVVSTRLVSKLNLVTRTHPTPYKLQWLSEVGEMVVNQQAEVPFSIGKYEDTILCDVVTMEASHMLLGRPWQYDRKAIHDGFSNKYTLVYNGKKIVLSPLSPKQVGEDQKKLRMKMDQEKKEEKK